MRNSVLSVLLFGTLFTVSADQIVPEYLNAVPVFIEIPLLDKPNCSYGTGMYMSESNKTYLATAAHVIFDIKSTNRLQLINSNATLYSFARDEQTKGRDVVAIDLKRLLHENLIKRHRTHDVAVIRIAAYTQPLTNGPLPFKWEDGVQPKILPSNSLTTWTGEKLWMRFAEVPNGTDSYILGFPVELLNERFSLEVDFNYPLVRKGIISQKNQHTGKLIIDSAVYGGNSGGPVLVFSPDDRHFKVAGLVTQFIPVMTRTNNYVGATNSIMVNSGYGVAEPIDYALELMRQ